MSEIFVEHNRLEHTGFPVPPHIAATIATMVLTFHPDNTALEPIVEEGLLRPQVIDALTQIQLHNVLATIRAAALIGERSSTWEEAEIEPEGATIYNHTQHTTHNTQPEVLLKLILQDHEMIHI